MKKLFLILILFSPFLSFCQKPKASDKPVYFKFIPIEPGDSKVFISALEQWKRLLMYDPTLSPAQKVQSFQEIENYSANLLSRLRLDSVIVDTASTTKRILPKK